MISQSVVNQFVQNATRVDATVMLVENQQDLRRTLQTVLAGNTLIYCPMETDIERNSGIPCDRLTLDYMESFFTVEEVPAAIAETGTIVCWSKGGRPVQASVMPVRHVAIVRQEYIFMGLKDFFETLEDGPPTNVTFITGPSRTADIELTLTTGVHGPEKLDIIVCLG